VYHVNSLSDNTLPCISCIDFQSVCFHFEQKEESAVEFIMLDDAILPMNKVIKLLHIIVVPEATHAIMALQRNIALVF
jgi:hypothetical protein